MVPVRRRKDSTLTGVFKSEDAGVPMVRARVLPGSLLFAHEASSWDILHGWYMTERWPIGALVLALGDGIARQWKGYWQR